jgi:hypothetical protein
MFGKQIVKYIEDGEVVDGEVVNEGHENDSGNAFFNFFASFFSGNHKPYNDNGREYNPSSGNWEHTAEANGNANQYQYNYETAQDYQGSAPPWDGYSGE